MLRLAGFLMVALLLVAACGDTSGPLATSDRTLTPTLPPATGPTIAPSPEAPTDSPSDAPTDQPTDTPSTTPEPAATPTDSPGASIDPSASPSGAPEAACSGSDAHRAFFLAAAAVMSWDVYCAVLPAGWSVRSGQYKQANGGFLEISYGASGGRTLALRQGAFCADPDGCVPAGPDIGAGSFGDREGTVVAGADGSWAVVVDRAAPRSWLAVGTGMDEATFRALAAALHLIEG